MPNTQDRAAVEAVVVRLYQQVLGRSPQPAEAAAWVDYIVHPHAGGTELPGHAVVLEPGGHPVGPDHRRGDAHGPVTGSGQITTTDGQGTGAASIRLNGAITGDHLSMNTEGEQVSPPGSCRSQGHMEGDR